jgi:hypothetical protein
MSWRHCSTRCASAATRSSSKATTREGAAKHYSGIIDDDKIDVSDVLSGELMQSTAAGMPAPQLARHRVLALNNRAACWLRLSKPCAALDDTWDAMAACCAPGSRVWERKLQSGPGWRAWTKDAYLKAILWRARAFEAAGTPLAAQADVAYGAQQRDAHNGALVDELARFAVSLLRRADNLPVKAHHHAPEAVVRGRWSHPRVDARAPLPPTRRGGAVAALGDWLYLYGGEALADHEIEMSQCFDGGEFNPYAGLLDDFWRLPLTQNDDDHAAPATPGALARWERLPTPRAHGGPGPVHAPRGAACVEDGLLVVLAAGSLWTYASARAAPSWRSLGRPWARRRDEDDDDPREEQPEDIDTAFAVHGRFAYLYRASQGLIRVCLCTGAVLRLQTAARAPVASPSAARDAAWPQLSCPLLWGHNDDGGGGGASARPLLCM